MPTPTRPATSEPADPFLVPAPPPWAARGGAGLLLLLFGAALLVSVVVRVPDTVTAPFVLVPVGGADPVRAPRAGTVAALRVREGQAVRQGEPAMVIRAASVGAGWAEVEGLDRATAGLRERRSIERDRFDGQAQAGAAETRRLEGHLSSLRRRAELMAVQRAFKAESRTAQSRSLDAEIAAIAREIEFKQSHLALARDIEGRYEKGYEQKFMSWMEYARTRIDAERAGTDLAGLERQLEAAGQRRVQLAADHRNDEVESRLAAEALEAETRETREMLDKLRHEAAARAAAYRELDRSLGEDMDRAGIKGGALRRELDGSQGNEQTVAVPCTGTVIRLGVRAAGALVQEGDVVAEVACGDTQLVAELTLPDRGVSRLRPGLGAKLFYDAFPYQRHGARSGSVRWVSPATVTAGDHAAFRAHVEPADLAIPVDGRARPLLAGMTGRAQIVVGRHALITYAFEPLRQLRENLAAPAAPAPAPPAPTRATMAAGGPVIAR